uniref:hypothetical protein n=1 Tax=Enterocloster clostridioformis TaxID=1531 RepID=UPI0025A5A09F|nr:hypothetical protein [Enterocloster clostridioformis]
MCPKLKMDVFYLCSDNTIAYPMERFAFRIFFTELIDSILKSYGYQYPEYGSPGINAEAAPGSQQIAEMVFETRDNTRIIWRL